MRSSYYSDRRFKRSSLAHELCSKIEVTPGPGSRGYRELPSNLSLFLSLTFTSIVLPRKHSMLPLSSFQRDQASSSLLAFVSTIYFLFASGEIGRFELRARMVFLIYLSSVYPRNGVRPPSPLVPPVQNRSPREFVDYNKCVCSSRRYRTSSGFLLIPLSSFPSSLSALSSPRFSPLALYPSLAAGFRYPAAAAAVAAARKKDGTDGMK